MWDKDLFKTLFTAFIGGVITYCVTRLIERYKATQAEKKKAADDMAAVQIEKIKDSQFLVGVLMKKFDELEIAKNQIAKEMLGMQVTIAVLTERNRELMGRRSEEPE